MPKKEVITPPNNKELTKASELLRKGNAAGGRIVAEKAVAVREGVSKPRKPK